MEERKLHRQPVNSIEHRARIPQFCLLLFHLNLIN